MAQLNFLLRNAKLTARRAEEARDAGVAEDLAGHVAKLTVIVKNTIPAHTDFSKLQDDSGFKELQAQHEALVRASASMKPAAATPPGSTPRRISSAAEDDARLKRYRERAQSSSGSQAKLQAKPASKGVADGADKHSSSDDDDDEVLRRHRQRQQNSQDGSKLMLRSRPTSTRSMLGAPASARASQTGGPAQKALLSAPTSFRRGATAAKKQEESDSDEEEWKRVKARAAARGSGTQVAKLANGHESDSAYSSADEWREQRSRRSTGDSFKSTKSDYNPQTSFRSQQGGATPPLSPRMKPQAELSKRRMSETNIGLKVADKSPLLSPRRQTLETQPAARPVQAPQTVSQRVMQRMHSRRDAERAEEAAANAQQGLVEEPSMSQISRSPPATQSQRSMQPVAAKAAQPGSQPVSQSASRRGTLTPTASQRRLHIPPPALAVPPGPAQPNGVPPTSGTAFMSPESSSQSFAGLSPQASPRQQALKSPGASFKSTRSSTDARQSPNRQRPAAQQASPSGSSQALSFSADTPAGPTLAASGSQKSFTLGGSGGGGGSGPAKNLTTASTFGMDAWFTQMGPAEQQASVQQGEEGNREAAGNPMFEATFGRGMLSSAMQGQEASPPSPRAASRRSTADAVAVSDQAAPVSQHTSRRATADTVLAYPAQQHAAIASRPASLSPSRRGTQDMAKPATPASYPEQAAAAARQAAFRQGPEDAAAPGSAPAAARASGASSRHLLQPSRSATASRRGTGDYPAGQQPGQQPSPQQPSRRGTVDAAVPAQQPPAAAAGVRPIQMPRGSSNLSNASTYGMDRLFGERISQDQPAPADFTFAEGELRATQEQLVQLAASQLSPQGIAHNHAQPYDASYDLSSEPHDMPAHDGAHDSAQEQPQQQGPVPLTAEEQDELDRWHAAHAARIETHRTDSDAQQQAFGGFALDSQYGSQADAGPSGQQQAGSAVNNELMQAIQASISQVLTGVRSDMQQLDAKWSSMWQQSAGACSGLQQDLAAMRTEAEVTARHTSSEMEVLASYILPLQERLAQLELRSQGGSPASTRTIQASADRSTTLHHAPPGDQPRQDVEDDRISGVMERLSGLEGKVSAQLDQLVRLHELKVAAIKSNVRTSVSEVASQAASPPTSRLTTPYTSPAKGVAEPDGYYDTEHFYADGHHTHDDGQADTQRIEARHDRNASPIRDRLRQTNAGEHGRSPGARSAYSEAAGAGHAGSGTAGHADWMVNLGEQVGDLQARLGTAASTKSVRLVQEEIGHLRAALEARTAEAGLYRKEYDGLCRKLDKLEAAQKQAAQEARSKVKLQALDAMAASALDKRLLAIEERLNSVQGQAAGANTVAQSVQQRIAALEWRVEKVATTFSATVKTVNNKQERLTGSLTAVRDAASMAEAKCSALGAEVARLHRSATKPGRAPELENCRSSHKRARESPGKSVSDRSGSVLTGRNLEHYY